MELFQNVVTYYAKQRVKTLKLSNPEEITNNKKLYSFKSSFQTFCYKK